MFILLRALVFTAAVIIAVGSANAFQNEGESRPARDMDSAENSILGSLMVHRNVKSKYICTQNPYACVGADRAELGLALIASSREPSSPKRLIELVRFKFDGGLSSDYKCYLWSRRKEVAQEIIKVDAERLSNKCSEEYNLFVGRRKGLYEVPSSAVCKSRAEITDDVNNIVKVLRSESSCDGF